VIDSEGFKILLKQGDSSLTLGMTLWNGFRGGKKWRFAENIK